MADSMFDRAVIPVASEMDAQRTCEAVVPHLQRTGGEAHVVHVIEHTEGYMDTTSTEQLEREAADIFEAARETFVDADITSFETHLRYGTDVVETVYDACDDLDATAVVFVTRHASRWKRLLTGDVALKLITENPYPAVVLPESDDPESEADDESQA